MGAERVSLSKSSNPEGSGDAALAMDIVGGRGLGRGDMLCSVAARDGLVGPTLCDRGVRVSRLGMLSLWRMSDMADCNWLVFCSMSFFHSLSSSSKVCRLLFTTQRKPSFWHLAQVASPGSMPHLILRLWHS